MEYTILVVEDEPYLRGNIRDILEAEKYTVQTASNGLEGLDLAKKCLPDLIISDIMMPQMNGFEFIEELIKHNELTSIPVIFLTAKTEQQSIRKGMKLGADDYLIKPFQIDDLIDAVAARLKKVELVKQNTNKLRDEISSKVSHELRTPLVPILGFSQLLSEAENMEQVKEMAVLINKNGYILHKKIEKFLLYKDILLFKEDKAGKNGNEQSSILSEDKVRFYMNGLDEELNALRRVKIEVEPISLVFDEFFFETMIKELIENALMYSSITNDVTLKGIKNDDNYKIEIIDSGSGMSEQQLKSLAAFGRFEVADFYAKGLGLGLAIAVKTVNLLGGTFKIKSELNKYTCCQIVLPLN